MEIAQHDYNKCIDCRWWEYDKTVTTKRGLHLKIGVCQARDEERNERRGCWLWKDKNELKMDSGRKWRDTRHTGDGCR